METLWFVLITFMFTAYVILDGFDLGAGIIHLLVARTDAERRLVLAAIGPFWNGNEVWLLAAGGTLCLAFPALYAAGFSGFYLPLMVVLWLFILRGVGIEFRSHLENPLWQKLFGFFFGFSSLLLTIFLGAALGNVVRGVPLDSNGFFFTPLWTTFTVSSYPGVLDWYTVLIGALALATLTGHGAYYIAMKTEGPLQASARKAAVIAWWATCVLTAPGLIATLIIRPQMLDNYKTHLLGAIFPIAVVVSLAGIACYDARSKDKAAFLCSSVCIAAMLGATAFGLYPTVLHASTDPAYSLTVQTAAAGGYSLKVALVWWILGMILVLGYFTYIYRHFRGKVSAPEEKGSYL